MNIIATIGVCGTREPDDGIIISDGATSKIGGVVKNDRIYGTTFVAKYKP